MDQQILVQVSHGSTVQHWTVQLRKVLVVILARTRKVVLSHLKDDPDLQYGYFR